jgi:hypothetical protein
VQQGAGQGMAGGAHDRYGTAERPPLGGRYRPWGIAYMGGITKGALLFTKQTLNNNNKLNVALGSTHLHYNVQHEKYLDFVIYCTCTMIIIVSNKNKIK